MDLTLDAILDKPFALRKLLTDTQYHTSKSSIPKAILEAEPNLHAQLAAIAKQLAADPDRLLHDTYTPEERKKDFDALKRKVVIADGDILRIDTRSRPGHKMLDHHMRHFYDVKNHKGVSVRSLMTQEHLEKALLANVAMHSTPYRSEIRRMLVMTAGLSNVTKYRAVTAKAIVQFFKARDVLDPCAGWGGRMLGVRAAYANYISCEPDHNTYRALRDIVADLGGGPCVHEVPAEEFLHRFGMVDLVLTSPPYYNLELYTTGAQSVARFPTWVDWSEKWLKPLILGCLAHLKPGGTSCWSVKNFKSDRAYPLADFTKEVHKAAGWKLVKTVVMTGSGRPGAKAGSEEETFCFQRSEQN
jgi:hypothetical protein